jgi:hypothetical protein
MSVFPGHLVFSGRISEIDPDNALIFCGIFSIAIPCGLFYSSYQEKKLIANKSKVE